MSGIGERAPDFSVPAAMPDGSEKQLSLADYKGKWLIIVFYPLDFTFVCPTEIIAFSDRVEEFRKLNCEVVCASVDSVNTHLAWMDTPRNKGGLGKIQIPLIADLTRDMSRAYDVLIKEGHTLRGMFIIDPEGTLQQVTKNAPPVGRSVDETLRLLQAFQFVAEHGDQVCPVNWTPGSSTIKPSSKLDYFSSEFKE